MSLAPGTRLGSFEVLAKIGEGGMGEVYRARDTKLGREVALKTLPSSLAADPERLSRFGREAQLLASLNHPHIAAIYGVEESDGVRALVLELVAGETLADRLRRGPLPLDDALAIAVQVALALEAAHDRGVVHRDLKPANVKLTPEGTVKVLDFGLAKALDPIAGAGSSPIEHSPTVSVAGTRAGTLLGTAPYMSPEQARGQAVDARTDIWAFGCLLYELLTGRMAFTADSITDVLAAIVSRDPDWRTLPAETPERIRRLLRRCLTKDVRRRLRHIADARLEIEEPESPTSTAASPPPGRERVAWATAAALLVALLAALGGLFRTKAPAPSDAPIVTRVVRLTSGPARESGPAISPDGKWVAYLSNARGPTDVWVKFLTGGDPVNLTAALDLDVQTASDIGGLAVSPDGGSIAFDAGNLAVGPRSFASWVIPAPLGGMVRKLVPGRAVRWARDGARIVYVAPGASAGDALWVSDPDGGNAREIAPRRGGVHRHWPVWSEDGQFIYYNHSVSTLNAEPTELYRVPASGGAAEPVVSTPRRASAAAPWPDGSGLLYASNPDTVELGLWWKSLRRPDAPAERLTTALGEFGEMMVSAEGRHLVATLSDVRQALVRVPAAGPAPSPEDALTSGFTGDLDPVLSPDGTRLVFSSTRGGSRNLWTSNADGSAARPLTTGTSLDEYPAVSPDGQQVAFISDRGGRRGIWVVNADGGAARRLVAVDVLDTISWSRDGSRVVFAVSGDMPRLQTVGVSDGVVQPLPTPGPAATPAWSPREDVIAYLQNMPESRDVARSGLHIAFVDASGRPVRPPIPSPNVGSNGALAWDPAGERLAIIGNPGVLPSAIGVLDPRQAAPPRRLLELPAHVRLRGVTWARDGRSLVVGQSARSSDIVLFEMGTR